jgi:hypothetical protein
VKAVADVEVAADAVAAMMVVIKKKTKRTGKR